MDAEARATLEAEARALCTQGDHAAAATLAIKAYGGEIFGLLVTMHASEADASDAFAETAEAIWRGLPSFAWECSLRTWAYAVARNRMRARARGAVRRRKYESPAGDSGVAELAEAIRTKTLTFLKTETRSRLEKLRDELPEDDRLLLVLRIDRKLAWNDLARVMAETAGEAPLADGDVTKESARLRKRFQLVKDRLRDLAKKDGLLG